MAGVVAGLALFAFEVDGVDDGVGALGGFDGLGEGLFAAVVFSVGKEDEGFAALLFAHELVGCEEGGVVEGGASASARSSSTTTTAVVGVRLAGVGAGAVDVAEGGLEFGAGGGDVLKELNLAGELRMTGAPLAAQVAVGGLE